jgi:hypothetical protein
MNLDGLLRQLNWDPDPLRPEWRDQEYTPRQDLLHLGLGIFKKDFIEFLRATNLKPRSILLFNHPVGYVQYAHIDGDPKAFHFAVNWIRAESQAFVWYRLRDSKSLDKPIEQDEVATAVRYNEDELTETARTTKTGPILINASVPHKGMNLGRSVRQTYSLRFHTTFNTWEDTLEAFQPWITNEQATS